MGDLRRCTACGAKHRDHRTKCLRCGAPLEPDQEVPARRGPWVLAGVLAALLALAGVTWSAAGGRAGVASVLPGGHVPLVAAPRADAPQRDPGAGWRGWPSEAMTAGAAAYGRGDYPSALVSYQRAMAEHPTDPEAINNVGQVLVRLGRAAEAIPLFERAASLRPGEWSYRFNLGRARGQAQDWPGAVAAYREAERLFPDDDATAYNLGLALQHTGADADAAAVLERAVAGKPDEAGFVLALARSYQRLSRAADARRAFERFLEMAPQSPDAAAARSAVEALPAAQVAPVAPGMAPPTEPLAEPPPS